MIAPRTFDSPSPDFTAVPMLPELRLRLGGEQDHETSAAIIEPDRLNIEGSHPVAPFSVVFTVDVDVCRAHLLGQAEFSLCVLGYAVEPIGIVFHPALASLLSNDAR